MNPASLLVVVPTSSNAKHITYIDEAKTYAVTMLGQPN